MWQPQILQLKEPEENEPLCSGPEMTISRHQWLKLRYFHAQVIISNLKPSQCLFTASFQRTLHCQVIIFNQVFSSAKFRLNRGDIGLTLFLAGFPCLSITGLDEDSGAVTITCSEIVESDLPTSF